MKRQSDCTRDALLIGAMLILVCQSANLAQNAASSAASEEERASLIVHAAEASEHPIPRHITGKFAEHLFFNVTNGMDAQILKNPTFSDYPFRAGQESPDGVATFHYDREEIARQIRGGAARWGWPES